MSRFRIPSVLIFLGCAFLSVSPLSADGGVLVPREVYVGDTAEFSFVTNAFGDLLIPGTVQVLPRENLPSSPLVSVESVLITARADGALVVIRFVPWTSGLVQLPPFSWEKIRVVPPSVRIGSVLELTGASEIAPPRGPLLVPGTTWLLYGMIGAVLAASAVCIFGFLRLRRYFRANPFRRESAIRRKKLFRELKYLDRGIRKMSIPRWYASFASVIRSYAGSLCAGDHSALHAATASEIVSEISARFSRLYPEDSRFRLLDASRALLERIDGIRFSGLVPVDSRTGDLDALRSLADSLESASAALDASDDDGLPVASSPDEPLEESSL